jgi:hypothetical protein
MVQYELLSLVLVRIHSPSSPTPITMWNIRLLLLSLVVTSSLAFTSRTGFSTLGALSLHSVPPAKTPEETSTPTTANSLPDPPPVDQASTAASSVVASEDSRRLSLLGDAIRSFNSSAATDLLSEINEMRSSGVDQVVMDSFLNNLLSEGPDRKLPLWARLRPLARFSKRARLASLRCALDLSTPPPNESDNEDGDDLLSQQRRRRRALVSLLRYLAEEAEEEGLKGPAILQLERKAKRATTGDLRSRLPEGLETPEYEVVVKRSSGYEVRRYDPFSVCSVSMEKTRPVDVYKTDATISDPKMSGARSFGALAGYLFGKNQQETAMKMTTPVLSSGQGSDRKMSFVLPSDFWKDGSLQLAPKPMEGSGVDLEVNMGGERAVVMFGGYASKSEVDLRQKKLLDSLAKDKEWEADKTEPFQLAQYNDPFTPPWKRLNEVSLRVQARQS